MKANTIVLTAADGRKQVLPLDLLVERGAIIADQVNGAPIEQSLGSVNQLWCPGLPAKYFVRDIVRIDFEWRDEPPRISEFKSDGKQYTNRPNVSVEGACVFKKGEPIHLEGYADDYDRDIRDLQFSLDGGEHWTEYPTEGARAGKWVRWTLELEPQDEGTWELLVRSVNERGDVSPVCARQEFRVVR
jgi:hypothetical protein